LISCRPSHSLADRILSRIRMPFEEPQHENRRGVSAEFAAASNIID
jgi:hypothetical protein